MIVAEKLSIIGGVIAQQISNPITIPDPIKQGAYTIAAATLAWVVGAALSWLARKLKLKSS